jgi:flagellar motor protein MotB
MASNLRAVGYGKSRLKNTSDPFAAENRRVEIVNTASQSQVRR